MSELTKSSLEFYTEFYFRQELKPQVQGLFQTVIYDAIFREVNVKGLYLLLYSIALRTLSPLTPSFTQRAFYKGRCAFN